MEVLCSRIWGGAKLKKPKPCNNKNLLGTVSWINKCQCKVWVDEDIVYVWHRDWFSRWIPIPEAEKRGLIDKRKNKFIYNDNFGSVVLRNEAIFSFKIPNLDTPMWILRYQMIQEFASMMDMDYLDLMHWDWEFFFEQIIELLQTLQRERDLYDLETEEIGRVGTI